MEAAIRLFVAACESVQPGKLVREALRLHNSRKTLEVGDRQYRLNRNVYVAGFGKASMGMGTAVEELLGADIVRGVVSIPLNTKKTFAQSPKLRNFLPQPDSNVEYLEGAEHNIPDADAYETALKIKSMAETLLENDILIVLVSGGGSALLPCPVASVTLTEKQKLIKQLSTAGASIEELNVVRQNLSLLKRGGLARIAYPAQVISLIFSDIIGNPLSLIASGPTVPPESSRGDALKILKKYQMGDVAQSIQSHLDNAPETEESSVDLFNHVQNCLIGDNIKALCTAALEAAQMGMSPVIVTSKLMGEAKVVGVELARLTQWIVSSFIKDPSSLQPFQSDFFGSEQLMEAVRDCQAKRNKLALIFGGETTVTVRGNGVGGRNQELSLSYWLSMAEWISSNGQTKLPVNVTFLSCGTDGQDGPTDAAGVCLSLADCLTDDEDEKSRRMRMGKSLLDDNNSNCFWSEFNSGRNVVKTGVTGTNVMDLQLILVEYL